MAKPIYMRSRTRKNSSALSSQRGIRGCGCLLPPPPVTGTAPVPAKSGARAGPGPVTGPAGRAGKIISGCWDILVVRTLPLYSVESPIKPVQISRRLQSGRLRPVRQPKEPSWRTHGKADQASGPAQGRRIATVSQPALIAFCNTNGEAARSPLSPGPPRSGKNPPVGEGRWDHSPPPLARRVMAVIISVAIL
jgi:hypothetical protein